MARAIAPQRVFFHQIEDAEAPAIIAPPPVTVAPATSTALQNIPESGAKDGRHVNVGMRELIFETMGRDLQAFPFLDSRTTMLWRPGVFSFGCALCRDAIYMLSREGDAWVSHVGGWGLPIMKPDHLYTVPPPHTNPTNLLSVVPRRGMVLVCEVRRAGCTCRTSFGFRHTVSRRTVLERTPTPPPSSPSARSSSTSPESPSDQEGDEMMFKEGDEDFADVCLSGLV